MTDSTAEIDDYPVFNYILRALVSLLIASGSALVFIVAMLLWSGILTW